MKSFFKLATVAALLMTITSVSAGESDYQRFLKWADEVPKIGDFGLVLQGETPEGIPCEVLVSNNSGVSYLSLGVGFYLGKNIDKNHYFGSTIAPKENFTFSEKSMRLNSSGRYYEMGRWQDVDLELEIELEDGVPVKARGKSTLQPKEQICTSNALTS